MQPSIDADGGPSAIPSAVWRVGAALIGWLCVASSGPAQAADPDEICDLEVGGAGTQSKPFDSTDGSGSHRYLANGVCFDVSGSLQVTGQGTNAPEPRVGPGPTSNKTGTAAANVRFETSKQTDNGPFRTTFATAWNYNTDTGLDRTPTLSIARVSYAGITLGFSESLMNFWKSDFQLTVAAPLLNNYMASYQYSVTDEIKLAVALEAGPPTSTGATTWLLPNAPPYYTTQLRYDNDGWALQASAALHEVDAQAVPILGIAAETRWGRAATVGATVPFKFIDEKDVLNAQLAYAVDLSIFLGTRADAQANAAQFPGLDKSRGWSGLASYKHNWTDEWVSNAFASYLAVDLDFRLVNPSVRTKRYGVNLVYTPNIYWAFGVEVDFVDTQIELNGPLGLIPASSLKGQTAYAWIKRSF